MHSTELFLRKEADTARQHNRRKVNMRGARKEIDIYISQGMEHNKAVNFVLGDDQISIMDKREIRQFFRYGCHAVCHLTGTLPLFHFENKNISFFLDAL
ncbi:MAG: hypothetical protein GY928_25960 [Colwellia sp.]|nr:hypothetical protein [Colwellia sp.]